MERTARIVLWKASPPFVRSVVVRSFTVRGWLMFTRYAAEVLSQRKRKIGRSWGSAADIAGLDLDGREWSTVADLACPDQPSGFFLPYFATRTALGLRNVRALVRAMGDVRQGGVNDWTRLWGSLDFSPTGPDRMSADAALVALCRLFPSLNPLTVYREQMVDFLDFQDGLLEAYEHREVAQGGSAPVAEAGTLMAMGGFGVAH